MFRIVFTPLARREALDAQGWYEQQSESLGARFVQELGRQLNRIRTNPHHFRFVSKDVRRAQLDRFPYEIYFREKADEIHIVACFHSSRNPAIWRDRV